MAVIRVRLCRNVSVSTGALTVKGYGDLYCPEEDNCCGTGTGTAEQMLFVTGLDTEYKAVIARHNTLSDNDCVLGGECCDSGTATGTGTGTGTGDCYE